MEQDRSDRTAEGAHAGSRWGRLVVAMCMVCVLAAPSRAQAPDADAGQAEHQGLLGVIGQDQAVLVRLHGAYGSGVTALGLRRVLDHAGRMGIRHAVLWLDSPGGLDVSGRAVADQMAELDAQFDFHVVVDRAQGAAVWTVAAADTLWTLPGGHAGAAVSYPLEQPEPGAPPGLPAQTAPEVVAMARDLAAVAEGKGRPGAVFRAMVDPGVELWTWTDAAGQPSFASHEPASRAGKGDLRRADTEETVVALGKADLERLGLARQASRGDVQHLLANQPFEVDRMLEAASRTVAGLISRRDNAIERSLGPIGKVDGLWARSEAAREAARRAEPDEYLIRTDYRTGEMTKDSARTWRAAVDQCLSHWRAYQSILKSIGDAETDHVRLTRAANTQAARYHADLLWPQPEGLIASDIADQARLDVLWREAEAEIRRLGVERARTR